MSMKVKQDERQKQLESIRVRIENGTYKIEADDLAQAIIRSIQQPRTIKNEGRAA